MNTDEQLRPIDKAIKAVGGNQTELAKRVGCNPQNITNIKSRGGFIPLGTEEKRKLWVKATRLGKKTLFPQLYR